MATPFAKTQQPTEALPAITIAEPASIQVPPEHGSIAALRAHGDVAAATHYREFAKASPAHFSEAEAFN